MSLAAEWFVGGRSAETVVINKYILGKIFMILLKDLKPMAQIPWLKYRKLGRLMIRRYTYVTPMSHNATIASSLPC